jgi:L-iditol 2-dehydrogenase
MKFAVSKERGKITIEEMPVPEPKEGEILVKTKACGICGSDLEKVYGEYSMGTMRIGHEVAGEIVKIGGSVSGFALGDRVFVRQRVPCYNCRYCLHGNHTICDLFQKTSIVPCGLSEYFIAPAVNVKNGAVTKLPSNVSFEEAAAAEPLSCCIRALNKCGLQKGDSVAIIGAGAVGTMFALALRAAEAGKLFLLDISDTRLETAKKVGIAINSLKENPKDIVKRETETGVDLAIVATSSMKVLDQALSLVRKGGKILIFGVPPKNSPIGFDAQYLFANEISILTSGYSIRKDIEQTLDQVSSGKIDLKPLITHTFPITKSQEAFDMAHRGEGIKIVIKF